MSDLYGWKDAIIEVLKEKRDSMHYTDIAQAIKDKEYRTNLGKTPEATVNRTISQSIAQEGDKSLFIRVDRGYYMLRQPNDQAVQSSEASEDPLDATKEATGFIRAFGMYWSREQISWKNPKLLLLGSTNAGTEPVNFSNQKGVYILYDGHRIVYVGRTTDNTIGKRLKDHTTDRLRSRWDRFSWFGVCPVDQENPESGQYSLDTLINTMEAILIEGMEPPLNRQRGKEFNAIEFYQVEDPGISEKRIFKAVEECMQQAKNALGL